MRSSWWRRAPAEPAAEPAPETRNYTDLRLEAIQRNVGGEGAEASGLAAVQSAAGLWARALAAAVVEPATLATGAVTASIMYEVGRALILAGEAVYLIGTRQGGLTLTRCSAWDVYGTVDAWRYRVTLSGPSGTTIRRPPADGVLHFRINIDPNEPHRGQSPVALAGLTADTAAYIERGLGREAAANHGYVIPAPTAGLSQEDTDDLKTDLVSLKGRTAMVPGMESFGDARPGVHPGNWQSRRLGIDPPTGLVDLRAQAAVAVLGACGVPPELVSGHGDGTGRREAWRQFLHGTIQPVAALLSDELRIKLQQPVTLSFHSLFASDIQGRGRAFQSLRGGGLNIADAARATGMEVGKYPDDPAEPPTGR